MKTTPVSLTEYHAQVDAYARKNPTRSLLIAAGTGLAVGFAIYALQTSSPTARIGHLIGGLQGRLHKLGNGTGFVRRKMKRVRGFLLS